MGELMNSFIQGGGNSSSMYYLKNNTSQENTQNQQQKSVQTSVNDVRKKKNGGFGKAVSSAIIPGTGQLFDGRFAPAAVYFISPFAFLYGVRNSAINFFKTGGEFIVNKFKHRGAEAYERTRDVKMLDKEMFKALYKKSGAKCLGYGAGMVFCALSIPILYGMNIIDAYKGKRVKKI